MAGQAQITSVEAIELFRAALIVFTSQARPALEEVSSEVLRTRLWVQNEQRRFWENERRIRNKKLEQARQELFTARLSQFQESTSLQLMAVHRAQQAVQLAEEKLARLKRWERELDNRSAPLLKEVEQLHGFLTAEMPKATAYLAQAVRILDAYAEAGAGRETGGENRMSAGGSQGRLVGVSKELALKWEDTKNHWRDEKSREFERKYLQELFAGVDKTVAVIEKLDELLKKVRSDCE